MLAVLYGAEHFHLYIHGALYPLSSTEPLEDEHGSTHFLKTSCTYPREDNNDKLNKQKMGDYTNTKRPAALSNLKSGDFVLVKQPKQSALTTP